MHVRFPLDSRLGMWSPCYPLPDKAACSCSGNRSLIEGDEFVLWLPFLPFQGKMAFDVALSVEMISSGKPVQSTCR